MRVSNFHNVKRETLKEQYQFFRKIQENDGDFPHIFLIRFFPSNHRTGKLETLPLAQISTLHGIVINHYCTNFYKLKHNAVNIGSENILTEKCKQFWCLNCLLVDLVLSVV